MEEKKDFMEWLSKNYLIALVCALVIGLLLGAIIMYFVNGDTKIAKVSGGSITTKDLYESMKNYYSIELVLENIDAEILNKKYTIEEDELKDLKQTAKNYIDMYQKYYGYTENEFLSQNGFKDLDEFVDYLSLDYKRTIYYTEYLEKQLDENAVKEYYDENAFGKVNTKHILVQTSDEMTDEEAQAIANEIIERLNNGEDFDTLAQEYTEKYEDTIISEDLGEKGAFDKLEESYVEGMKALNKGEYSTTPVATSYGYHVIYCVEKIDKTDKIPRKDRIAIVEELAADIMSEDSKLYIKTLIKMREEAKLKFFDEELQEKYEEYKADYIADEIEEK